jgi:hypothetical protein
LLIIGGKMKIDKSMVLWGFIAILLILVVYVVFFQGSASAETVGPATQAARASYSGMVGGC